MPHPLNSYRSDAHGTALWRPQKRVWNSNCPKHTANRGRPGRHGAPLCLERTFCRQPWARTRWGRVTHPEPPDSAGTLAAGRGSSPVAPAQGLVLHPVPPAQQAWCLFPGGSPPMCGLRHSPQRDTGCSVTRSCRTRQLSSTGELHPPLCTGPHLYSSPHSALWRFLKTLQFRNCKATF